jgi:two-component system phosphate regulon response regulator PhoB
MNDPESAGTDVLLIGGDGDFTRSIRRNLAKAGFKVHEGATGTSALESARHLSPQALVLDADASSDRICRSLKGDTATANIPLVVLSTKSTPKARIDALESGADDFLTKPFDPRELVLRLQSVIRRYDQAVQANDVLRVGPFEFHRTNFEIRMDGERAGRVVGRETLFRYVWGMEQSSRSRATDRTLDTHVRRLRAKLGKRAEWIVTERGEGYRLRND